jgi:hypothetical protein
VLNTNTYTVRMIAAPQGLDRGLDPHSLSVSCPRVKMFFSPLDSLSRGAKIENRKKEKPGEPDRQSQDTSYSQLRIPGYEGNTLVCRGSVTDESPCQAPPGRAPYA